MEEREYWPRWINTYGCERDASTQPRSRGSGSSAEGCPRQKRKPNKRSATATDACHQRDSLSQPSGHATISCIRNTPLRVSLKMLDPLLVLFARVWRPYNRQNGGGKFYVSVTPDCVTRSSRVRPHQSCGSRQADTSPLMQVN
jgi:hypothetical protein